MVIGPMQLTLKDRLIIIVGNYGSGKTETAVNLAFHFNSSGTKVAIADLDVVNPYFRCREQLEAMTAAGIRVVVPEGAKRWADLPIVLPEIKGMAQADDDPGVRIFDVGGDDVGATLLASLRAAIGDRPYALLQVVNTKRPFTDSVEGVLAMKRAIELKSGMTVNGFIANAHLMEETTPQDILEGIDIARQAARVAGVETVIAAVMSTWRDDPALRNIDVPILFMERRMLPPWKEAPISAGAGFGPPA